MRVWTDNLLASDVRQWGFEQITSLFVTCDNEVWIVNLPACDVRQWGLISYLPCAWRAAMRFEQLTSLLVQLVCYKGFDSQTRWMKYKWMHFSSVLYSTVMLNFIKILVKVEIMFFYSFSIYLFLSILFANLILSTS